jgi:hypothetical protein
LQVKALIPIHQYDKLPSYFIFAGLVFVPLTQPYLHEYGDDWYNTSPRRLCERAMRSFPTQEGEQMVIISQVGGWRFHFARSPTSCGSGNQIPLGSSARFRLGQVLSWTVYSFDNGSTMRFLGLRSRLAFRR